MAETNAKINVSVNGLGSLDTLEKKLTNITTRFSGLKTKLAGVGFAAFGRSALAMADDLTDLSNATGIAIGRLIEYKDALITSGGQADQMAAGIVKFTQAIDDAAQGSLKAQNAFAELNITLDDLKTLSEEDLLTKALEGFDNITDKSREAGIKMDLFGKSFKTVDPRDMADKLRDAAGAGDKYAQSIKNAADLNDKLAKTTNDLKIAFLQVTAPFVNFIQTITDNGKNIDTLVNILKVLGTVLLAVFGGGIAMAVVRFFGMFARGIAAIGPAITQVGKLFTGFGQTAVAGSVTATRAFAPTSSLMTALRGVLALAGTVGGALAGIFGLGGAGDATKPKTEGGDTGSNKETDAAREVTDALAKKRLEIQNVTSAFKQQNNQLIDNLNVERMLIGKSAEEAEITKAQEEIYKRSADEAEKLRNAKLLLSKDEAGLIPIYDEQIKKIGEAARADAERIKSSIENLQSARLIEQDRLNNLTLITQQLQKQQEIAGTTSGIYSNLQKQLGDIMFGKEQRGRSVFDQQKAEIERNIQLLEADLAGAITEAFSTEDGITNVQQYQAELKKVYDLTNQLKQAQLSELDISRQWATGWQDAFSKYIDSATNAATMAGSAFSSITQNMNNAIDNFVTTGKFKFGDFARSVIQDLIKIELKAQATQLLKATGSGIGSILGSIFGGFFAEGGNPPINKPSIVGEKGPELFVPKTAGTIIPNGGSMANSGTGGDTYITNNISALDAKSVAQLFAENRKTLFGTVELARKEVSYGVR